MDESAAAAEPKKGKKTKAPPRPKEEKRAKRYRASCPKSLLDRLGRAQTQRLYLVQQSAIPEGGGAGAVDFTVLGSTGNVYTVTLSRVPGCNCPDHQKRQDLCKHLLFVLLKVVGLDISDPLSFQKAYLTSELERLFEKLRARRVGGTVLANERVRAAVAAGEPPVPEEGGGSNRRRSLEDDGGADCPICFDALTGAPADRLTYCRAACGANFHADCIRRWLAASSHQGCPNCRQPWQHGGGGGAGSPGAQNDEGYANYGSLQGQSSVRDTSTYYSPSYYKRRRWR